MILTNINSVKLSDAPDDSSPYLYMTEELKQKQRNIMCFLVMPAVSECSN